MRFPLSGGIGLGVGTTLVGMALDKEQSQLPTPKLIVDGLSLSFFNLLVLGPFFHMHVAQWTRPRQLARRIVDTFLIVGIHSGLYALCHRAMHKVAALRGIHADHHRFKNIVFPSAANAVSAQEFVSAYMMPFAVATRLLVPCEASLNVAIAIVSVCNLLVHSPHLASGSWLTWLVHPKDHNEHHRTRAPSYAAPTFSWKGVDSLRRKITVW